MGNKITSLGANKILALSLSAVSGCTKEKAVCSAPIAQR